MHGNPRLSHEQTERRADVTGPPKRRYGKRERHSAIAVMLVLCVTAFGWDVALADDYQPGVHRFDPSPAKNSGDMSSMQICPKGEYLVGFTGRTGAWVDRIGIRCAALLPSGEMGDPHGTGGMGGGGGAPETSDCKVGLITRILFETVNDYRMIYEVIGDCIDPRTGVLVNEPKANVGAVFGHRRGESEMPPDSGDPYKQRCPQRMAATGLRARFGKDVNSIGLICDKLAMPISPGPAASSPPRGPSRMLFCQGGGMTVGSGPSKLSIIIEFKAAPESTRTAIPARGECAWQDTPVAANEPKRIYVPIKSEMKPLVETAQKGGIFLIHAAVQGDVIQIDKIDSVNVGFVPGSGVGR